MYDPAKLAGLNYRLCVFSGKLRDAKARLRSSHVQSVLKLLKIPLTAGKSDFQMIFFTKFLRRTSEVRWEKLLKITFCKLNCPGWLKKEYGVANKKNIYQLCNKNNTTIFWNMVNTTFIKVCVRFQSYYVKDITKVMNGWWVKWDLDD